MEPREVKIGNQRLEIAYRKGHPDLAPLLLVNGIGQRWQSLMPLVRAMPSEQAVITFNVPGIGRSAPSPLPFTISDIARLADHLMSHFGYEAYAVMGISWGGSVAQEIAYNYSDRCQKLILAATTTGALSFPGDPLALGYLIAPWNHLFPSLAFSGRVFGGNPAGQMEAISNLNFGNGLEKIAFYQQLWALAAWTSAGWLHQLRQATLILAGNDDPIAPKPNARFMASSIAGAQYFEIDGGHLFPLTHAPLTAALVTSFLWGIQPRAEA